MSKFLLVSVTASVLLTTLQAEEATTSAADFKPRDDPFVLYEELKEVLKKVNPQLLTRVNEEEKEFKNERDTFHDETKHFVDQIAVMYLEVAINTLKGQLSSQSDVYLMAGKLLIASTGLSDEDLKDLRNSVFYRGLMWGRIN